MIITEKELENHEVLIHGKKIKLIPFEGEKTLHQPFYDEEEKIPEWANCLFCDGDKSIYVPAYKCKNGYVSISVEHEAWTNHCRGPIFTKHPSLRVFHTRRVYAPPTESGLYYNKLGWYEIRKLELKTLWEHSSGSHFQYEIWRLLKRCMWHPRMNFNGLIENTSDDDIYKQELLQMKKDLGLTTASEEGEFFERVLNGTF